MLIESVSKSGWKIVTKKNSSTWSEKWSEVKERNCKLIKSLSLDYALDIFGHLGRLTKNNVVSTKHYQQSGFANSVGSNKKHEVFSNVIDFSFDWKLWFIFCGEPVKSHSNSSLTFMTRVDRLNKTIAIVFKAWGRRIDGENLVMCFSLIDFFHPQHRLKLWSEIRKKSGREKATIQGRLFACDVTYSATLKPLEILSFVIRLIIVLR